MIVSQTLHGEGKGELHPRSLHRPDYLPKLIQRSLID
jgi:hypothetical protein